MSGGSGMNYGDGETYLGQVNCMTIFEKTVINSPKEEVISNLLVDDTLEVSIRDNIIVLSNKNNEIAGSITIPTAPAIIQCMEKGHRYIARVLEVDDGACHVEIRYEGQK